ncbi:machado-joseph disease-like protein [Reticulomyxa filosa]|uniref:ubiquitinyl hydrolase 1 n=1 Tax=Reticulomyxa filosa TaxID=46433 RepID=X6PEZ7_RETFI|nr:machado-joseph disease-like protein [Reticulomyxa filosa]|eukprot:ETO36252.1 machado-joseph disease-like protein [Reticulomyxa filosa]
MAAQNEIVWIYHERQESALCARHCLNNLLQGTFVSEFDLAKIGHWEKCLLFCFQQNVSNSKTEMYKTKMHVAQELDKEEHDLVAQGGDDEMIKWMKAALRHFGMTQSKKKKKENNESQNVGLDGNFSVQVIRRALANLHLELLDLGSEEATEAAVLFATESILKKKKKALCTYAYFFFEEHI